MPSTVKPSSLVTFIDLLLLAQGQGNWGIQKRGEVATILARLQQIEPQLVDWQLSQADRDRLDVAREQLSGAVAAWDANERNRYASSEWAKTIADLLRGCRDDGPAGSEPKLKFIRDRALRESVARDIDSLSRLMAQEEWKAATVIGGSVVEALLLYKVEQKPAVARAFASRKR